MASSWGAILGQADRFRVSSLRGWLVVGWVAGLELVCAEPPLKEESLPGPLSQVPEGTLSELGLKEIHKDRLAGLGVPNAES